MRILSGTTRRSRRAALTLVEVLVAVALGTIVVGIVVSTSVQVQRAIALATMREMAVAQVRGLFVDLEHDIARMIPTVSMPTTFTGFAPIALEGVSAASELDDPSSLERFGDKLRVFTSCPHPDPNQGMMRAIVEYKLDEKAVTGGGAPPEFRSAPGGWLKVGRLRRHIQRAVIISDAANKVYTEAGPNYLATATGAKYSGALSQPVLVDNVISFQLRYVPGTTPPEKAGDTLSAVDDFDAAATALSPTTADGTEFLLQGNVEVKELTALPKDAGATKLLTGVPIGSEILLFLKPSSNRATPYLVRQKVLDGSTPPQATAVYLNDRPYSELGAGQPIPAKAFLPPAMIRVTIMVAFGRGPESETARFSRNIPVSR